MRSRNETQSGSLLGLISVAILVLVLLAVMIRFAFVGGAELYMGMYIVLGIGVLLIMLTIMTIAFARLNLANSQQALGLPEGSIRALIALILLLVFIVLSIYIFRVVGSSNPAMNEDGAQLAQQLVTTLATLAVAVSGFYF
ncbi:MAG TPA: hypothetical protein VFY25_06925, partial [Anaerolineales bacterium]|nr:hypothetical protein [Anaerolineales bacterium]